MKTAAIAGLLALALMGQGAAARPADPMVGLFAQGAGVSNAFEIAEAKIILETSTDDAVRDFARAMLQHHEMAQQALDEAGASAGATTRFELGRTDREKVDALGLMDSPALDKAYLADQVDAHAQAAATLQAYAADGSDPAMRSYAREALPVVLDHQNRLEQLTGQPKPL